MNRNFSANMMGAKMPNQNQSQGAPQKLSKDAKAAVIKRISRYLFAHTTTVVICFLLMVASNVLALVAPKLSQKAMDAIELGVGSVDLDSVIYYCTLMFIFYILSAFLSYLLAVMMVKLSQKIVYTMRRELFNHLTELPVGFFDTHATGDISRRS